MISAFPFTIFPLLAFNAVAFLFGDALPGGWASEIVAIPMYSSARFVLTAGDVMVVAGLFFLFIEMLRATIATSGAILNHMASVIVLLAYVIEFVLVGAAANSTFFLLTMIALIDVLGGFAITARTASRDVSIHSGGF